MAIHTIKTASGQHVTLGEANGYGRLMVSGLDGGVSVLLDLEGIDKARHALAQVQMDILKGLTQAGTAVPATKPRWEQGDIIKYEDGERVLVAAVPGARGISDQPYSLFAHDPYRPCVLSPCKLDIPYEQIRDGRTIWSQR